MGRAFAGRATFHLPSQMAALGSLSALCWSPFPLKQPQAFKATRTGECCEGHLEYGDWWEKSTVPLRRCISKWNGVIAPCN